MMERRKNLNDKFGFVEIMEYTSIGESCSVVSGGTPSRSKNEYWENGNIPWIKIGNIKSKYVNEYDELITEQGLNNSSAKLLKKGTILYTIFATLGEVAILDIEACTNQAIAGINITNPRITTDYLYYYLKSKKDYVNNIGRGVAQNNINLTTLKNFEIPLIDVDKQLNIVEILEKVERMICLKEKEIDDLDLLIKARFVEMFCHKGYTVLEWNDVFNTRTGKLDSNAATENGKYPFFTCSKDILYIDDFGFDQEALLLAGNNAAGKYDVKYYKGKFNAYQRTYVLTLRGNWSYQLFRYQLEDKLEYLRQQSLGGLTKYLTMKILGELSFIIPPIEKQKEFELFVQQVDKSRFIELLQDHGVFDLGLNTDEMDTYYHEFLEQVQDQKQEVIDNQEIILTLQDTSLLNVFHEKTSEEIQNELEKEISEMFNGIEGEDASKLYDSLHNQIQYA